MVVVSVTKIIVLSYSSINVNKVIDGSYYGKQWTGSHYYKCYANKMIDGSYAHYLTPYVFICYII